MLFTLTTVDNNQCHYLWNNVEYIIGRRNAKILILDDESISRKHAIIKIKNNIVYLVDCKSKYKTMLRNNYLEPEIEVPLTPGDRIKFGIKDSIFIFDKIKLLSAHSALNSLQKGCLKRKIESCGGELSHEITSDCNYLTVTKLIISVKVLYAIMDKIPIVTIDYWDKYQECIRDKIPPPNANNFKPPIAEALLNKLTLDDNFDRTRLFLNKIFVFSTRKLHKEMEKIIEKAGGTSISFEENPIKMKDIDFSKHIFIKQNEKNKKLLKIYDYLEENEQRTIPLQEIARAIVYCNCTKECNPNYKRVTEVFKENTFKPGSVIVEESQSQMISSTGSSIIDFVVQPTDDIQTLSETPSETQSVNLFNDHLSNNSDQNRNNRENQTINTSDKTTFENVLNRKRKEPPQLTNSDDVSNVKKKRFERDIIKHELVENPFSKMSTSNIKESNTTVDNPFLCDKIESVSAINRNKRHFNEISGQLSQDNCVFKRPKHIKIVESQSQDNNINNNNRIESSKNADNNSSLQTRYSDLNETWLSKSNSSDVAKIEINNELKEIFKKFEKSIVIQTLELTQINKINQSVYNNSIIKKKNFKVFKKVSPLKPQTMVIQ